MFFRIKALIKGRDGFIVPGVLQQDDLYISDLLGKVIFVIVGLPVFGQEGRFPLRKISMGSDRDRKKIEPAHGLSVPISVPVLSEFEVPPVIRNPDDKELEYFQLFGPAVRIIQDGKMSSPSRSGASLMDC